MDKHFDVYPSEDLKKLNLNTTAIRRILTELSQHGTAEQFVYDGLTFERHGPSVYKIQGLTATYTMMQAAQYVVNRRRQAIASRKETTITRERIAHELMRTMRVDFEHGALVHYRGMKFTRGFGQDRWVGEDMIRYSYDEMLARIERVLVSRIRVK